ncbi:MAG TPA: hypothetical protein VJ063_13030, partial [Verrucomicrobiae bacterium]|nr:hypothetical protein [Verrucomicrobiae bacterium]
RVPPACIRSRAPALASDAELRGIAPFGVRTFLPSPPKRAEAILRPSKIREEYSMVEKGRQWASVLQSEPPYVGCYRGRS